MEIVILFILGVLAGIVAGLFGLGGGILFTPILFVMFSNAGLQDIVVLTIASSLFCSFVATTGSSLRQYRQNNFYLHEGLKVGVLGAIGVSVGRLVITSPFYSKQVFTIFFSLLLIYVAFMFYKRGKNKDQTTMDKRPVTWPQASVTGGLGGFVAALAGIGGGGVMVPLMNLLFKKQFAKAVSISSLAIILITLSGWIQLGLSGEGIQTLTPWHWGYVDFGAAAPLAVGGLLGGFAGAYFNLKTNRRHLQYAFAILALGMATKMLIEAF
ncbi:MAG TPA: sulfite exporter TauE/SafE family protein [Balneolaceae bacterium]|nr:sulfite exporter TauE/SafE family protein [Balneolaceae bacterium]